MVIQMKRRIKMSNELTNGLSLRDVALEMHILQEHGTACLNRDDSNTPKTTMLGGKQRSRISKQRGARDQRRWIITNKKFGKDYRSCNLPSIIKDKLIKEGKPLEDSSFAAELAFGCLGVSGEKEDSTNVMLFMSEFELDAIKDSLLSKWNEIIPAIKAMEEKAKAVKTEVKDIKEEKVEKNKKTKDKTKEFIDEVIKTSKLRVALEDAIAQAKRTPCIAGSGRMVASSKNMNIDGAVHGPVIISVNECEIEDDFWTAIDDLPTGDGGAANMGHAGAVSPCYYKFQVAHLGIFLDTLKSSELSIQAALASLEAFIKANSTAKISTFANYEKPQYVRVIVRKGNPDEFVDGAPRSFVNAFSLPAKPTEDKDMIEVSIGKIKDLEKRLDKMHGDSKVFDFEVSTKDENTKSIGDLLRGTQAFLNGLKK